jgi:ABC-type multidrug transport system fused ATPase/permease subunit
LSGGDSFSASQAITTLSILSVMMSPLGELVGNIPNTFSAFGCFKRIQDFLLLEERIDHRDVYGVGKPSIPKSDKGGFTAAQDAFELKDLGAVNTANVFIVDGSFNWGENHVLKDITASFPRQSQGSLTMIIGPIGSGKSSLLKAVLGEIPCSNGLISLNSAEIAFCDQTPWVMNATIRENIIAESKGFESAWFDTVVSACDLVSDISRLPERDDTIVGDKGVKLSGGQKQRLVSAAHFQGLIEEDH